LGEPSQHATAGSGASKSGTEKRQNQRNSWWLK
jgi:hypothetical protein